MAEKENKLTVYQNLTQLFNADGFGYNEQMPSPTSPVGSTPSKESRIIIKGNSPEEIHRKGLEIEQKKELQNKFFRTTDRGFQKALQYEAARLPAYMDYEGMEYYPLIASALDLFMEEATTIGLNGKMLNIYSNKERIKYLLEEFFYDIVNVNVNLPFWTRNTIKYGDNFVLIYGERKKGITHVKQLVNYEIERFERIQNGKPTVRFKERMTGDEFNTFEIAHFRLLGDDKFLPYGNSVLNKCRRVFRELIMAEDAMLTYRIVRAGEKKVFKIDVGNIDEDDIENYIYKVATKFKKTAQVAPNDGQIDYRFNLLGNDEDYFLPVRNANTQTGIDTLPGACLALDTKIDLLDGRSLALNEIIKEYEEGKELWSYSINPETGEIVPGIISWAGVTRKNTDVLKLTLDNGESITCTPDHKFPTKFNGTKEAKDLSVGESMWAFNKIIDNKTQYVYDHKENKYVDFNLILKNFKFKKRGLNSITFLKKCSCCENIISDNRSYSYFNKQTLCSRECYSKKRSLYYNGNKIYNYKGIINISQTCEYCNKKFNKKIKRKYCSIDCYYNSKIKLERIIIQCKNCGKEINKPSNGRNQNFCSLTCKKEYYFTNKNNISNFRKNRRYYKKHQEIFNEVRNDCNNICQFCFEKKENKNLDVHHILASKLFEKIEDSFMKENLIPLHNKCHQFRFEEIISNELYNEGFLIKHEFSEEIIKYFSSKINQFYDQLYIDFESSNYNNFIEYLNDKTKKDKNIVHFLNLDIKNCNPNNLIYFNNIKDYWNYCKFDIKKRIVSFITEKNFNHKIVSIEYLSEKQDTGTITIDGNEKYHNYHNFALSCGIFTKNSNLDSIHDIEYLRDNLMIGLGIPKPFLSFQDAAGGGKNLAQFDIRFSKKVNRIQQAMIQELNKMAMIHLYLLGYSGDDLKDFTLTLTNPSTQQELLKSELMREKAQTYGELTRSENGIAPMSHTTAKRQIFNMSDREIVEDLKQQKMERVIIQELQDSPVIIKKSGLFTDIDKRYGEPVEGLPLGGNTPQSGETTQGGSNNPSNAPAGDAQNPNETPKPQEGQPFQTPSELPPVEGEGFVNKKAVLTEEEYNKQIENLVYGKELKKEVKHKKIIKENDSKNTQLNTNAMNMINEIDDMLKQGESINKVQTINEVQDVNFEDIEDLEV